MITKTLRVEGMYRRSVAAAVEKIIAAVRGVKSVSADLDQEEVLVEYDAEITSLAQLKHLLSNVGYESEEAEEDSQSE